MEVDSETAPAIEALIQKYPEYMKVEDLPIEQLDTKMKVVQDLWEKKLLLTKEPLEAHYDDWKSEHKINHIYVRVLWSFLSTIQIQIFCWIIPISFIHNKYNKYRVLNLIFD